jgi:hypothetical protein
MGDMHFDPLLISNFITYFIRFDSNVTVWAQLGFKIDLVIGIKGDEGAMKG